MLKLSKTAAVLALSVAALSMGTLPGVSQAATTPAKPGSEAMSTMEMGKTAFVKTVAGANRFEIETSKLALKRSKNADVRSFAEMMVKDHTEAGKTFMSVIKAEGIKGKKAMAPKQAAMLKELEAADAEHFDRMYIDIQTQAHMEAVATFRTYAGKPDNMALGDFAKKTLPTLEKHLDHVQSLKVSG